MRCGYFEFARICFWRHQIWFYHAEAENFVRVGYRKPVVVVELRQYVPVSLHLPHSVSSDTDYMEACQESDWWTERRENLSNQFSLEWTETWSSLTLPSQRLGSTHWDWWRMSGSCSSWSGWHVVVVRWTTAFWHLENSYVEWRKRQGKHYDHIVTDLDVIGATESEHLPIICLINHHRLGSRHNRPMKFVSSRVPDPVAWAESDDLPYATDVSRNAYARKLDGRLRCAELDTLAKHMAESVTHCGRFGKPKTGGSTTGNFATWGSARRPSPWRQPRSSAEPWADCGSMISGRSNGCVQNTNFTNRSSSRTVHGMARNKKPVCTLIKNGGNIWEPDDWPDLVHPHFVDLYKAPESDIMVEKRELESLSHAAMRHGGHARATQARAVLVMALEPTERKCKPEEHDEQPLAYVDGSYIPCPSFKENWSEMERDQGNKRKKALTPDGGRIGWGFVGVRIAPTGILGHDDTTHWKRDGGPVGRPGTCENDGINENDGLIQSFHGLHGAWLTVRGGCTFAGKASFSTCNPGGERLWLLVSDTHRAIISMIGQRNQPEFVHVKAHDWSPWHWRSSSSGEGRKKCRPSHQGKKFHSVIILPASPVHSPDIEQRHPSHWQRQTSRATFTTWMTTKTPTSTVSAAVLRQWVFRRQNGDLETMELCWPRRTHSDFKPNATWTLVTAGFHMVEEQQKTLEGQLSFSPTTWNAATLGTTLRRLLDQKWPWMEDGGEGPLLVSCRPEGVHRVPDAWCITEGTAKFGPALLMLIACMELGYGLSWHQNEDLHLHLLRHLHPHPQSSSSPSSSPSSPSSPSFSCSSSFSCLSSFSCSPSSSSSPSPSPSSSSPSSSSPSPSSSFSSLSPSSSPSAPSSSPSSASSIFICIFHLHLHLELGRHFHLWRPRSVTRM